MREAMIPAEFSALAGKVHYVRRVTAGEWSSSCPNCGGSVHKNGDFPDRFRMWPVSKHGKPMGWCRSCGYMWFPDKDKPPTKEQFEQWRKDQIAAEEQRKREAEKAIALLKSERIWEYYQTQVNDWGWSIIEGEWGIRRDYAEYWKLGMIQDYVVSSGGEQYHSPAISIPVWSYGWDVKNVKVRVLNPKNSGDRYRSLYKTGAGYPFVAWPELKSKTAVVVEGEKKAMVVAEFATQEYQIVGIPTKTPDPQSLRIMDDFELIYVCLDPDANRSENGVSALRRLTSILGKERVAPVYLPGKVDDMIIQNGLDINDALRWALKEAK